MKKTLLAVLGCLLLANCGGYVSRDNTLIGQVKKVEHNTPLVCFDFDDADVSLGVMRGGVGSMSTQDVWVYVPNAADYAVLEKAQDTGALVKITYDRQRFSPCSHAYLATKVEITK